LISYENEPRGKKEIGRKRKYIFSTDDLDIQLVFFSHMNFFPYLAFLLSTDLIFWSIGSVVLSSECTKKLEISNIKMSMTNS